MNTEKISMENNKLSISAKSLMVFEYFFSRIFIKYN